MRRIQLTLAIGFFLASVCQPLNAATLFGTVTGPDGLVAGAKVIVNPFGPDRLETTTDEGGSYSLEVSSDFIDLMFAEPVTQGSGLIGDQVGQIDISSDREIHLFLDQEVTIRGQVLMPDGYEGEIWMEAIRLDKQSPVSEWYFLEPDKYEFEAKSAAGVYAFQVSEASEFNEFLGREIVPVARYFSSVAVDAHEGSVHGVVVPVAEPGPLRFDRTPPNASLIQVGPVDDGGIAMVSGAPGTVAGPALIGIVNLQTGQFTKGASYADGSFDIPFYAPPGSFLEINQDPTGFARGNSNAAGTIVGVPVPGSPADTFATTIVAPEGGGESYFTDGVIASVGLQDVGQIWISGELDDRDWSQGDNVNLGGVLVVYSNNVSLVDPANLSIRGEVLLERVFDESGSQELANAEYMSHVLTPTGLPIDRRGSSFRDRDAVSVGEIETGLFAVTGPRSAETSWQTVAQIPDGLPDGTYQLVFEPYLEGLPEDNRYFTGVYVSKSDKLFSVGGAGLVRIGSPDPGRLTWAIGLNDFSNGSRGIVGLEDQARLGIAGHVTTNTNTFILPREKSDTEMPVTYRLEPFVPLIGASNRGWITPPTVPFQFPSGSLSVQIKHPDNSVTDLGKTPFTQPYIQEASSLSGNTLAGVSVIPRQYYGLTTLSPRFEINFSQYGRHLVMVEGVIDDIWGTTYEGGGTYEVFVAKQLDLETGVFPNTPFEVGDAFSTTTIVQPGVAADVQIIINHYPQSDKSQLITHTIEGQANRFGYFHANSKDTFIFDVPGEYRVDVTASYRDEKGVLWMGAETWASVVETPNSTLITHGERGHDANPEFPQPQWFLIKELENPLHFFPPFHTGDIIWMLDGDADPFFAASTPSITIQDTVGDFENMLRERISIKERFDPTDFDRRAAVGEIPLFSSTITGISPVLNPDANDTHWAYAYTGVARPGVSIREMVSEDDTGNGYWRFDDTYYYQPGNGANGDLPNDFKFHFGGAVYRAPDQDFFYYGAYGSLWAMLRNDDPDGGRLFPPFQGNGGGPSGGPIMTLKGQDIDMFFHLTGTRPGSILEVGDVASFAGQMAPTLPLKVEIVINTPSGENIAISGQANKVGYFYDPATDFTVEEAGLYTVNLSVLYDGRTSAGQVQAPFPTGDVLGSRDGEFYFYVVDPESGALTVDLPRSSFVEPGKGAIDIDVLQTDDLSNVQFYFTTVLPGFILEESMSGNLTYTYDAPLLHQSFPNIDLDDEDLRTGVDTITMSFLVSGEDGGGNTVYRARQVLLQGEELLAMPQQAPASNFKINTGHSGAWFYPETSGQGQFIDVEPEEQFMFISWFTYTDAASSNPNQQQWYTAQGNYSGNTAQLEIFETLGGQFDNPQPVTNTKVGTTTVTFSDCGSGQMAFDFDDGRVGQFPMERVIDGSDNTCLQKSGINVEAVDINAGMDGAWFEPETSGQGFFIDSYPDPEGGNFIFVSWFTYGDDTTSGQRWLTAQGSFAGSIADIDVFETTGGSFNDPQTPATTKVGTMNINFSDCSNAQLSYSLPADPAAGDIAITRVIPGGQALCQELAGTE